MAEKLSRHQIIKKEIPKIENIFSENNFFFQK